MKNTAVMEVAHHGMGTEMAHRAYGLHAAEALQAVQNEAGRLEGLLSRFLPKSDVGRINRSAGIRREKVSAETACILEYAIHLSRCSGGLFDATVGPLAGLWDYKHATAPPPDEKIRQVLSFVNFRDLDVNPAEKTASLKHPGQSVDLGGIGKGFASDRFMKIFQDYGITSAFSNIGGNVSTLGNKPDGLPWQVGIRHPRQEGLMGAVAVTGKAVVTSGDYERFFIDKLGRRFHHILNPLTGYPAESGLISVTIIADSAMTADALSTNVFVAGLERGLELIRKHLGVQAILTDDQLRVYVTRGLYQGFQPAEGLAVTYV
jgi:thiamine biosynthesis lipoprotein